MIELTEPGELPHEETKSPMLSNRSYDFLKKVVQLVLPALGSLYFGIAQIWGLAYAEEVVGTLALIATFFGVLLGLSNRSYQEPTVDYDGHLVIMETEEGGQMYSLELSSDPEDLAAKDSIKFKVQPHITLE